MLNPHPSFSLYTLITIPLLEQFEKPYLAMKSEEDQFARPKEEEMGIQEML
jgi:hypothetical protein